MTNNQDNVYEGQTLEFSLKDLFSLINKSAFRILVFVIIAVLIASIIQLSIFATRNVESSRVVSYIDLNFEGIENGLDPFGNEFDIQSFKSPYVVSQAILALNERGEGIPVEKTNAIINAIALEGVMPEDIAQQIAIINKVAESDPTVLQGLSSLTYFPSRYKISIEGVGTLDLSKKIAKSLLDEIVNQYISNFKETYSPQVLLPDSSILIIADEGITENSDYDFIELFGIFDAQLSSAESYLTVRAEEVPIFRSYETAKTFSDLLYAISVLKDTNLVKYEAFVIENGISVDSSMTETYLSRRMIILTNRLIGQETNVSNLKTVISEYEVGDTIYISGETAVTASGETTEQYDFMMSELIAAEKDVTATNVEISNLQYRIDAMEAASGGGGNSPENKAIASDKATSIATQMAEIMNEANDLTTEYYQNDYFKDSITKALPATYDYNQENALISFIAIIIAAAALASLAAMIVTYFTLKKKGLPVS